MTTNSLLRMKSKSISDLFSNKEWDDEDKEELLPNRNDGDSSFSKKLEKWKSSLTLKFQSVDKQKVERRTSRGNSIFSRPPPSQPRPRRQSLAVTTRRTSAIKDDIKKVWSSRRSSLSNLKENLKDKITGRSSDNL